MIIKIKLCKWQHNWYIELTLLVYNYFQLNSSKRKMWKMHKIYFFKCLKIYTQMFGWVRFFLFLFKHMLCLSRLQVLKKKNNKNSQIYLQSKTVSYSFHVQVAHSHKSFPSRLLFYCCSWNVKPCWISFWLFLNLYSQKCRERHQARVGETLSDWDQTCCAIAGKRCLFSVEEHGHKSSPPSWIHHLLCSRSENEFSKWRWWAKGGRSWMHYQRHLSVCFL